MKKRILNNVFDVILYVDEKNELDFPEIKISRISGEAIPYELFDNLNEDLIEAFHKDESFYKIPRNKWVSLKLSYGIEKPLKLIDFAFVK